MQLYRKYFKRLFDFIFSVLAFSALIPVFIIITFVLFFTNNGQPFFLQRRPGLNGMIFILVKFKTMNDLKDNNGNFLPDAKRITAFGKFLRQSSLDEIPQLINVICGHMSIIGPRPLLVEYLPLYNEHQKRRHEVRPGITGWAQVNGRNAISWKEKFELDVWYVDNLSLLLDLKIIYFTLVKVFKKEGINQEGHVTMSRFTGS